MDQNRSIFFFAAITAALLCGNAPSALAQQQTKPTQSQSAPAQVPQTSAVSDQEIRAFAAAATDVQELSKTWTPKLQAASQQGPEAVKKTRQEAMAEMAQAVQKHGLSVDKYNQIAELTRSDPEIRRRVQQQLQ